MLTADPSTVGGYDDRLPGGGGLATVTMTDDDAAGAGLTFWRRPTSEQSPEGDSGTFTVVLEAVPTGTVTVTPSLASGSMRGSNRSIRGSLTFTDLELETWRRLVVVSCGRGRRRAERERRC